MKPKSPLYCTQKNLLSQAAYKFDSKSTAWGGLRAQGFFKDASQASNNPIVSVIMVVFNSKQYLEQAIQGVLAQTYTNTELIIIDGGSTDGSLDIIQKYNDVINFWLSEPDNGISDAFNKGLLHAQGEFHLINNSDDWLEPDAIDVLASLIDEKTKVVSAGIRVLEEKTLKVCKERFPSPEKLYFKMSIPHGTSLIHIPTTKEMGMYPVRKKIAMDHFLFLKIMKTYGVSSFKAKAQLIGNYRLGGESDRHIIQGFREVSENIDEVLGSVMLKKFAFITLSIKYYLSQARSYSFLRGE